MKIHEYQAKDILRRFGIPVQPGKVATTPEQAEAIAREFAQPVVIKAQVYVGGRGKAGGIQFGDTPEQARAAAARVLGMDIKGLKVEKALVTPKIEIADEYYLGVVLDRNSQAPVVMVSAAGGVDIEQVAEETPEKIIKQPVDVRWGLLPFQARLMLEQAGVPPVVVAKGGDDPRAVGDGLHGERRDAGRDQSAGADERRPGDGRRRQNPDRRQRATTAKGIRQLGRVGGDESAGLRGQRGGLQLCEAGRRHRCAG